MEELVLKTKDNTLLYVIATYHDDNLNKDFLVYTDKTYNLENKLNVYYSNYQVIDNEIKINDTMSVEEKKVGLMLLKEIMNDLN